MLRYLHYLKAKSQWIYIRISEWELEAHLVFGQGNGKMCLFSQLIHKSSIEYMDFSKQEQNLAVMG